MPADRAPSRSRLFELTLSSALAGGLTTALAEYALTLRHTHPVVPGDRRALLLLLVSLYGVASVVVGVIEGLIIAGLSSAGAIGAARAFAGRVAGDERFDREVAGWLIAGCAAMAAFAWWVMELAQKVVVPSHRHFVASALCGAVAAISAPVFVLLVPPLRRLAAPITRALPRVGRLPATVVLVVAFGSVGAIVGGFFLETHLDWRDILLGPVIPGGLFLALQPIWAIALRWTIARVRWPRLTRRPFLALLAAAALALPLVTLRRDPRPGTMVLLFQGSYGGRTLAVAVQRFFDRDHDGFSTLLGGGDCDDHDRTVHPGAHDVPDDGIDQNCLGGDAHAVPLSPPPPDHVPGGFSFRGNVIFLFIDTLRADRVDAARMPNLDALARGGVRFSRAYAQAPGTSRSFPSLVTSRLPSRVQWDNSFHDFPGMLFENQTVFESLHDAGYRTVGFASHFYFVEPMGMLQGFDAFDNGGQHTHEDDWQDTSSPRILAAFAEALPGLARDPRPFAALIHLTEPHGAYKPHPEVRRGKRPPSTLEERYDEEVTYLDGQLGRLFGLLASNHVDDRTMIVVFADHGEAFGLHREDGQAISQHGQTLYDDVLRVPLIFSAPGLSPHEVEQPVMLVDVSPTVLDALGVPRPAAFQGRSLAGALAGLPLARAPVYAELLPRVRWPFAARALIDADGRTKVIYRITQPSFELYDLERDPREQTNIGELSPALMDRMRGEMAAWLDASP